MWGKHQLVVAKKSFILNVLPREEGRRGTRDTELTLTREGNYIVSSDDVVEVAGVISSTFFMTFTFIAA